MIIYLITFLLSICFLAISLKSRRNIIISSLFWVLAIILPCLLAAFRGFSVGTDIDVYQKNAFLQAQKTEKLTDFLNIRSNADPLYYLNTWISARFFNIQVMFFLNELFVILPIFISFRIAKLRGNEQLLGAMIFYFFLYNSTLNIARQSIALSFCVLAYCILANRNKKITGILLIVIASLFHQSALFFLILVAVYYFMKTSFFKKHKKTMMFFASIVLIAIIANFSEILKSMGNILADSESSYQRYVSYADRFNGAGFMELDFIYSVSLLVLSLISVYKVGRMRQDKNSQLRIFGLFSIPGWFLNMIIQYSYRIFLYLEYPFLFLEIPKMPSRFETGKGRILAYVVVIILSAGYWFDKYIINNSCETYPYVFYWQ